MQTTTRRPSALMMGVIAGAATLAAALALALAAKAALAHDAHAQQANLAAPAKTAANAYTRAEARYEVPDVQLLDRNGARASLRGELDAGGKPVILNFIFTSCTAICPVMSATMSEVQSALGADRRPVRIVSISIDPEHDTPARLRDYAERHRAGPDWHLLTGDKQAILQVARAFDAWRGDKMNHTPSTYLRAGPDQPWVRLDGFATPNEVVREYRSAVAATAKTRGG